MQTIATPHDGMPTVFCIPEEAHFEMVKMRDFMRVMSRGCGQGGTPMNINPIRTEQDYKLALQEVSRLVDLDPDVDSDDGARLEILSTLVEAYEARHFPIESPDPIEAIRFRMEQGGLTAKDLVPSIGKVNRVYEVLTGKRKLTLPMIRSLHKNLGIPAESLIGV